MKIKLHEYQQRAWDSDKRFISFCAGVQGGKTTFGACWMLRELQQNEGVGDYIIIAPTYKVMNQSTQRKFFSYVPRGYGTFHKGDSMFETINGQHVYLRSTDNPAAIEGITANAIWADEASLMKAEAWLIMQGRVSRTMGRILLTFTPTAMNWVYHELYKRWLGGDKDYDFIQFANVESPYFPKEEYERVRRTLSQEQFEMRYGGQFRKMEGLIYPEFRAEHIIDSFALPKDWKNIGWRKLGGIDFGYNNPFVALKGAVSPDDVLYIYDEYFKSNTLLADHAEKIADVDIRYEADPSGKREIMELKHKGVRIRSANNEVNAGIDAVRARIRTQRLRVVKSCRNLIDEFETYAWMEDKDKPQKERDHGLDSLRYMILGHDGKLARPRIRRIN